MLPVGPEVGQLLNMILKAAKARSCLELGASAGYSTLWLAEAAREVGGHVYSMDANPDKHRQARENLIEAGLIEQVTLITGDALVEIPALGKTFDFVLLDVWKDAYVPCYEALRSRLNPGAIIAADNMIRPESGQKDTQAYQAKVRATAGMDSVLVPIGSGVEISRLAG